MARQYVTTDPRHGGNRDADGLRDMVVEQRIGDGTPERIVYRTFGEETDSPSLFAAKVGKMLADKTPAGVEALAAWYGSWVYGEDLKARQKGKAGGPSEPLVAIGEKQMVNLVTGKIHSQEDTKVIIPGGEWPLADRIEFVNSLATSARLSRKPTPKAVLAGIAGLEEAGVAKMDAGRLVAVATKGNGPTKK
jgi:hypothetical protein